MISWILSRIAPKMMLYIVLGLFAVNLTQFVVYKFRINSKINALVELAVSESHAKRDLLVEQAARITTQAALSKAELRANTFADIAERREKRRQEWQLEGLKWKNKYLTERCEDDDEICLQWGSADYRGDG